MVRIQVYLTEEQHGAVRRAAEHEGLSMTALLRKLVDQHVRGNTMADYPKDAIMARKADYPKDAIMARKADCPKDAIMAIVGLGASGRADISERHDDALAEFFRSDAGLDREPDPSDASS
jgi:hypothetical protein